MKNTDRQNQFHFPNSQEFLAVREGIKPVMRVDVSVFKNLENIIELCKVNKLHFMIRPVNRNSTNPVDHAYISKSKSLIEQAHQSEKRNGKKLGELLGYPECCVDSFFKTIKTVKAGGSFVLHSFLETRGEPLFYLNNILNTPKTDVKRKVNVKKSSIYFLISHIPCSYDCKESIRIGKSVLKILRGEIPELARQIVSVLKNPFLVFDDFNWVVFDGEVKKNKILYGRVFSPVSSYPENKLEILKRGNRIEVDDEKITIFKDDKPLNEIEKENKYQGIIIDFS